MAMGLASAALCLAPVSHAQYQATPAVATTKNMSSDGGSIADLVEVVSKATVNIVVTTSTGEVTSEGQGSGFLISPQGEVVTNYHVIDGGDNIDVVFNNGNLFKAEIVGTDEETDLALLKIKARSPFPHVKFHQGAPIRIGDWVIAIGNPYGIGQSTSLGIISAIGRDRVESGAYVDYIQTDATINTGNSGGPLFNPQGDVIGVNSAIFSPTGASVGIGFSIPHFTAEEVINQIKQHGRVRRGYLGAGLRTAEFSGATSGGGAIVNNVVTGSPAHLYGLQTDDIILKINGQSVANSIEATRLIAKFRPNQQVNFLIERNESEQNINLKMAERPSKSDVERAQAGVGGGTVSAAPSRPAPTAPSGPLARPSDMTATGLSLVDLSADFRRAIGMSHDQTGVYVEGVNPGSPASSQGIKSNMVLLEFDQQPISSVSDFRRKLGAAKQVNQSSALILLRLANGSENYVSLPI